jgi:hypothetical protein
VNRIERVVVDEGVGPGSPLVEQLLGRLGERSVQFVFLATDRPGIPDIEILDKLLDAGSALLTRDRVLHNLAIGRGFQSFVHTPESGLTDRRLGHVTVPDKNPPVASGGLRDSYLPQASPEARAITQCLYGFLFELRLHSYPLSLYHMDGAALARCVAVVDDRGAAATAVERMAARLLAAISKSNAAACTKGRFFDRASDRLKELATFATNELVPFDMQAMAAALADDVAPKPDGALQN